MIVAGRNEAINKLCERLAPGRKVRRLTIDAPARGLVTATVEVLVEEDDLPLIEAACPDEAAIVEVKGDPE
jgi:hypothetical protein